TAAQVSNNGSSNVVITAPLAAINATLADASGLQFDPATGFTGDVTLTMATDDQGNTGSGGNLTDTDTRTITVRAPNQAAQATNKPVSTAEDPLSTFSVSDFGFSAPDGNNFLAVKIASLATAGTLKLDGTAISLPATVSTTNIAANKLTFAPAPNANGTS